MAAVYRLAAETPGMSRRSLANKASGLLGWGFRVDQAETALAWARAARAAWQGTRPSAGSLPPARGPVLPHPERKGDIATRVAAALAAADAGDLAVLMPCLFVLWPHS